MSKFRAAALSAALIAGFAGSAEAQTQGTMPCEGARVEGQGDRGPRHRGMRRAGKDRAQRGMRQRGARSGQLMRDLNLSAAQQTRLTQIREKYRPQYQTLREQNKTQRQSLRSTLQKGDTSSAVRARVRQQMEQFRTRAQAIRQQEHNEIRGLLTTEQRTKWDARTQQRKSRMDGQKQKMRQRRGARTRA
ncbi:MAG: Spy/CpxP family protein refolding chaperone [Gemmatimonadota bacterium]|nr:Spy/CpxP family protein refolding chaperone [Gemmatimonadota bacterium]